MIRSDNQSLVIAARHPLNERDLTGHIGFRSRSVPLKVATQLLARLSGAQMFHFPEHGTRCLRNEGNGGNWHRPPRMDVPKAVGENSEKNRARHPNRRSDTSSKYCEQVLNCGQHRSLSGAKPGPHGSNGPVHPGHRFDSVVSTAEDRQVGRLSKRPLLTAHALFGLPAPVRAVLSDASRHHTLWPRANSVDIRSAPRSNHLATLLSQSFSSAASCECGRFLHSV